MLVVLDNFEQVLPAGKKIEELLAACSNLKVLATSRSPLRLRTERPFVVEPLALPEVGRALSLTALAQYAAVALFVERAGLAEPGFALTAHNAEAVADICRRVDGLPLAIELVAARVRLLPPESIVARLARPLHLLTGGAPDAPRRQQTMRDAIAWSYELLSAREQRLFRELAVFVGGCSLQAAEAVCNEAGDLAIDSTHAAAIEVLDGVQSLVDKSLVRKIPQEGDDPRLAMLETVREYAWEQVVARGEAAALQRRHADYFVQLAAQAEPCIEGKDLAVWLRRLGRDHDNLRAALSWLLEQGEVGPADDALRLLVALRNFWDRRTHLSAHHRWLERALTQADPRPTPLRSMALRLAARAARRLGDYPGARVWAEAALTTARELGDEGAIAGALNTLAAVMIDQRDFETARALLEDALLAYRAEGADSEIPNVLINLGETARMQGDYRRAEGFFQESLRLAQGVGDPVAALVALTNLGHVATHLGDWRKARTVFVEALVLAHETDSQRTAAEAVAGLARALLAHGERPPDAPPLAAASGWPLKRLAQAAQLLGVTAGLLQRTGKQLEPPEQAEFDRTVATARARLGEAAFTAAWEAGRATTFEQALAIATQSDPPAEAAAGPGAPVPPQEPPYPDALTEREVDVLRLIAAGKSNQEIAVELVLSRRTAERHTSNIYQKIGATGKVARATATAYALRHGLSP
jgi:predicted ATPase/DNA-binding CsgD family transcriptional regulator